MRKSFDFLIHAPLEDVLKTYKCTDFFVENMKRAGADAIEIIEEESLPEEGRRWKAKLTDIRRLPDFLHITDVTDIINETTFLPDRRVLLWQIMPSIRQKIVRLSGEIRMTDTGQAEPNQKTKLVYDVSLTINIPLVGPKTEPLGLQLIGRECARQAAFLTDWLSRK